MRELTANEVDAIAGGGGAMEVVIEWAGTVVGAAVGVTFAASTAPVWVAGGIGALAGYGLTNLAMWGYDLATGC